MSIRVGVVGAAGYVGSEMCRWVLAHPDMTLAMVVSRSRIGTPIAAAIPALLGATDVVFSGFDADALCELDVVVLATPHGAAAGLAAQLGNAPVILDCSRDHRHAEGWVFGQPE